MQTEEDLLLKAKKYLKRNYLETTVSMDTMENNVINGRGQLKVYCTVRLLGLFKSDWIKTFTFKDNKIVSMQARRR